MDYSISRQAAIKESARWTGYIDEDMILRIQTGLKKLPSAQPEIIRCEDCKSGRPYKHKQKEYVECKVDCEPIDRDSDFFCKYGERIDDATNGKEKED